MCWENKDYNVNILILYKHQSNKLLLVNQSLEAWFEQER